MTKRSESKTENLFRGIYGVTTFIEKSQIPDDCGFKSKNKTGEKGYPDFYQNNASYDIVVEIKANNQIEAIDDIKFYMNHNNIKKDIIGIAFSGQSKAKLAINYYFKEYKSDSIVDFGFPNQVLDLKEIEKLYIEHKYGDSINDEDLVEILNELNTKFHKDKIVRETNRSLFFSSIMIALKNENFKATYRNIQEYSHPREALSNKSKYLNEAIINAIEIELSDKINNKSKEIVWGNVFAFINSIDYNLKEYIEMIEMIETKVFIPFKYGEKQDILGKAYTVFLKRAGKIENKNIILTPDHIKKMMVKLARITENDIVLDTCMGSGGFLMEAMEVMIEKAKGNKGKIASIKENQLIGIENDHVLFALACSNMFLHGDGRTNLLYRSSVLDLENENDIDLRKWIKEQNITKIIINPPYESSMPIEFVEHALDFLSNNGELIIIMPNDTLVNSKGRASELLEYARLNYIIKMPDNLFTEQNRDVNTSIFSFTKAPQEKSDEIMLYRLDDDGLVSVQHKGRLDRNNKWEMIENEILVSIFNKKPIENKSLSLNIYNEEGWDFEFIPKNYSDKFKLVRIGDVFNIEKGTLQSSKAIEGKYNFITAADEWKSHTQYTHDKEAIVYASHASGSLGRAHYINGKFIASDLTYILTLKEDINLEIDLEFYSHYLNSIRGKMVEDIKKGNSKYVLPDDRILNYEIEYIPYLEQVSLKNIINERQKKLDRIKEELSKAEATVLSGVNSLL